MTRGYTVDHVAVVHECKFGCLNWYHVVLVFKDRNTPDAWQACMKSEEKANRLKRYIETLIDADGYMSEDNKYKIIEASQKANEM